MVGLINPTKYGEHFYELYIQNMLRKNVRAQKRTKRKYKEKTPPLEVGDTDANSDLGTSQHESQVIKDRILSLANFKIPEIELEPNASKFAIYYAIRSAILEANTKYLLYEAERSGKCFLKSRSPPCCLTCSGSCSTVLNGHCPCHSLLLNKDSHNRQESDISEGGESDQDEESVEIANIIHVPLLVGAGLRSLFVLISEARLVQPTICTKALKALLEVLQGLHPESLKFEPDELINPLYDLLIDLATKMPLSSNSTINNNNWSSIACSALISLCIARGDTGKTLKAVTSLLMSPKNLYLQKIQIPLIFYNLQKTVICAAIGKLDRPNFFTHGIPHNSLLFEFDLNVNKIDSNAEQASPSMTADGNFIYLIENGILYKIGTGFNGTLKGYIYAKNENFTKDKQYWIGFCKGQIFYRKNSNKNTDHINIINPDSLTITGMSTLNLSSIKESSNTILFTDGDNFNVICNTNDDSLIAKRISIAPGKSIDSPSFELPLQLSRKKFVTFGTAYFEEELLNPAQLQRIQSSHNGFEPKLPNSAEAQTVLSGKDFGIVLDTNGRVHYYGKSSSLGLKSSLRSPSMKMTELVIGKSSFITQIALGHDGVHAVMVNEDGTVFFAGTARRGEDGDTLKNRRQPKPVKPKKITKVEGHVIVQAACNNGTSAFVTNNGKLIMFGKDTAHCDSTGFVTDLLDQHITKVALGKAHCVALNSKGQVFTFGLNNKGQCGRQFLKTKEGNQNSGEVTGEPNSKTHIPLSTKCDYNNICDFDDHNVIQGQCKLCILCRECTGYNNSCVSNINLTFDQRLPGSDCLCGLGDAGCSKCGMCSLCISKQESEIDIKEIKTLRGLLTRKGYKNTMEDSSQTNEIEKDPPRVAPLPPKLVCLPNTSSPVIQIACGLHHSVLLTLAGEVFTFGSNQYGQLGTGDTQALNGPYKLNLNVNVVQIGTGSNHTVLLSNKGMVYTFGSYQKGQLGRSPNEPNVSNITDETKPLLNSLIDQDNSLWNCIPSFVAGIGTHFGKKATWIGASGDQTFIKINESLITSHMLSNIHAVANRKTIVLLPKTPMDFQTLSINRLDGNCKAHYQNQTSFNSVFFENFSKAESEINQNVAQNYSSHHNYTSSYKQRYFASIEKSERKTQKFEMDDTNASCSKENSVHRFHTGGFKERQSTFSFALDPQYNVLWVYNRESKKIFCYNVLSHELNAEQKDYSYKCILSPELVLPEDLSTNVTRLRAALNLMGCLDVLTSAQESIPTCFEDPTPIQQSFTKEAQMSDYQVLDRFENFGGGWGYSGHSVEAIRFSVDTEVIIYGFGIFGGRGEYTCKLKLFDLGTEGGGYEKEGVLISETKEISYECPARTKFHILLPTPIKIIGGHWYLVWARIAGPSSDCGSCGQSLVTTDDQVVFSFKTSKKANNGTDVNSGQIPAILYRLNTHESNQTPLPTEMDPVYKVTKAFAGTVTKECFDSLVSLLQWSWDTLKVAVKAQNHKENYLETKSTFEYLRYLNKFCLRLMRKYTNEIYPPVPISTNPNLVIPQQREECTLESSKLKNGKHNKTQLLNNTSRTLPLNETGNNITKKPNLENLQLAECIGNVRALIINILCDDILFESNVQEGDSMVTNILDECHSSFVACFDAFYPTSHLKWNCLCDLLIQMDKGIFHKRFLSAILAGLCSPSIKLRSTFSLFNVGNECQSVVSPSDNSGLPMLTSSELHQYPILVEQMIYRTQRERPNYLCTTWSFKDVLGRLLDIMVNPVRSRIENIYNRKFYLNMDLDHEVNQGLIDNCCNLLDRVLAEIVYYTASNDMDSMLTPSRTLFTTGSRFSRTDLSRTWNTGNFGPDAIAFSVDRPGISIAGVMAYSGSGPYEYQLDLLCDNSEDGHCQPKWETLLSTTGSYDQDSVQNDLVEIKFCRPVAIKENIRYSLRLCTHGARTCSGDGGLPSVRGPCGTNFYFYTCDLSFNGTTSQRGQIPSILYFSSPLKKTSECLGQPNFTAFGKSTENSARDVALQITTEVIKKCADILVLTRNAIAVLSSPSDISSNHTQTVDSEHNITPIEEHMDIDWSNNSRTINHSERILPLKRDLSKRFESFSKGILETLKLDKGPCNPFDPEIEIGATEIHPRDLVYEEAINLNDLNEKSDFIKLNGNEHAEDLLNVKNFPTNQSDSDTENFDQLNEIFNKPFSKIFYSLLPLVCAHISNLAFTDPKSSIQILSLVKDILPHVAALNQLFCTNTRTCESDFEKRLENLLLKQNTKIYNNKNKNRKNLDMKTTSNHYCIVESEHPYRSASVNCYKVEFPPCVQWLTIEFDSKSGTAQSEDTLLISIPENFEDKDRLSNMKKNNRENALQRCLESCKECFVTAYESEESIQKGWILVKRITNEWPKNLLVLPGNCVEFSLETSSLYALDSNINRYGFKCLIVGYDNPANETLNKSCLIHLEQELSHLGGMCAAYLMKKDLKLPDDKDTDDILEIEDTIQKHHSLLSKGFATSEPTLTIEQALQPQLCLGSQSIERQFLKDFISGAPGSSGGRLASWLQPEPRLDPNRCELSAITEPLRCGWPAQIIILIRDQYGDPILVPDLRVEIKAIPTGQGSFKVGRNSYVEGNSILNLNYEPTFKDKMCFKAITFMKAYHNYSFEELRYSTPIQNRVTESIVAHDMEDGSFLAEWIPNSYGNYCLSIAIDGILLEHIHRVEVKEGSQLPPEGKENIKRPPLSNKLRLFYTQNTAGLRIRAHPTLQSEQVGVIKLHGLISFIDEIENDDGCWVRLSTESIRQHCTMGWYPTEAWCLQYNQHLNKTFLHPVTEQSHLEKPDLKNSEIIYEENTSKINTEGADISPKTTKLVEHPKLDMLLTIEKGNDSNSSICRNPFLNSSEGSESESSKNISFVDAAFHETENNTKSADEYLNKSCGQTASTSNISTAIAEVVGEGANKLQALQKWLKGDPSEVNSSSKCNTPRKLSEVAEFSTVSVKDIVRAIGGRDVKFNGNSESSNQSFIKKDDLKIRYPFQETVRNATIEDFDVTSIKSMNYTPSQKAALLSTPKHSPRKHQTFEKVNNESIKKVSLDADENSLLQVLTVANEEGDMNKEQIMISECKPDNELCSMLPPTFSQNSTINYSSNIVMGPIKRAIPPSFAESIRSVFAAFLWHEGVVHDAMACASFLKFHPSLPKEGATVITRKDQGGAKFELTKEQKAQQRHSVEVANAGHYLNVRPSTLETLTKRGNCSQNNRKQRKTLTSECVDFDPSAQLHSLPEVITVLPPSLRCIVYLWEEICSQCIHFVQSINFEKTRNSPNETSSVDIKEKSMVKEKEVKKPRKKKREDGSWCEICEVFLPIPVTYHMRIVHPGCGNPAKGKGYNSVGMFCEGWAGNCGEGGKGASSWFLMCDICRDKYISAAKNSVKVKHTRNSSSAGNDIHIFDGKAASYLLNSDMYTTMKENAIFLLELSPIPSDLSSNSSILPEISKNSPHQMPVVTENQNLIKNDIHNNPTSSSADPILNFKSNIRKSAKIEGNQNIQRKNAYGLLGLELNDNTWDTSEDFACLKSFGVNNQDDLSYQIFNCNVGDPFKEGLSYNTSDCHNFETLNTSSTQETSNMNSLSKFHRSVSMGQGWNFGEQQSQSKILNIKSNDTKLPKIVYRRRINSISGNDGSLLMSCPSENLRKLIPENLLSSSYIHAVSAKINYPDAFEINNSEYNSSLKKENVNLSSLKNLFERPAMSFIMEKHDLEKLRHVMQRSLRIAACRTYSLRALNWLLRTVTQAICLHDLMWWFVNSLNSTSCELPATKHDELDSSLEHPATYTQISGKFSKIVTECLHIFLQSVADITLFLPLGSPIQRMAIQCFGIKFSHTDHQFLHNSHVFGNISKILSKSEEEVEEKNSLVTKDNVDEENDGNIEMNISNNLIAGARIVQYIDLNGMFDVNVSSRPAMVESLTDNSTETFWESDEDDRNKCKVIELFLHHPNYVCKIIMVHIDNSRDIQNKVQNVLFYSGQSLGDTSIIKCVEVDQKACSWISTKVYESSHNYFRIELHGQENTLRVRQIKLLGLIRNNLCSKDGLNLVPSESSGGHKNIQKSNVYLFYANRINHQLCEAETLRVFRLITAQVFGKLIATSNEDFNKSDMKVDSNSSSTLTGSLDLREHMVGILFSRSKLSHLQKQVIVHIVHAIKKEAQRAKDDWESINFTVSLRDTPNNSETKSESRVEFYRAPDNYCFEMLSMVLALSGSSVGRAYLSHQYGLLKDLLSLLHTGSDRVQRQVISLLRRILPEISPATFAEIAGVNHLPNSDYSIVQANNKDFDMNHIGLLDIFLGAIGKSLQLQVKIKNSTFKGNTEKTPTFVSLANSLDLSVYSIREFNRNTNSVGFDETSGTVKDNSFGLCSSTSCNIVPNVINLENKIHFRNSIKGSFKQNLNNRWFLRGMMSSKQAENIIQLLREMASGKFSDDWSKVTKAAIAEAVLNLTHLDDVFRKPENCIKTATLWLALSSLCVLDREHVEKLSSSQWSKLTESRPMCSNHDDGETVAVIECENCGSLCNDCDRYLHLNRKTRYHKRTVCKEEEEAIRVELHESCGRIRLFWLLALADSKTLKGMVEFRDGSHALITGPIDAIGRCRFCGITGNSGLLEIGNVCADAQCQEHASNSCMKIKSCGHPCGGVANEKKCLPCLQHECHARENVFAEEQREPKLTQDADDMCMICFIEALSCAPSIQLECGHVFHYHCCKVVLEKRWIGPRITFGFSLCPICKADMQHDMLNVILDPINALKHDVTRKALMRIKYEGIVKEGDCKDLTALAMDRYAYYVCFKCQKAYYGGEARCDAEIGEKYNPEELVCGGCSDVARAKMCPKHGTDFLEYKCRYCCSVAVFFCFGTTHFCDTCHDDFQRLTNIPKNKLPQCPAGPKANQLMGEECPLHIIHPPTGEEFALGCGVCRNAQTF